VRRARFFASAEPVLSVVEGLRLRMTALIFTVVTYS